MGNQGSSQVPPASVVNAALVARGTRATALAQVVTQVVRFLTNVALARMLAPEAFGVVAAALVVTMLIDQLRDMGTGAAVIQRPEVDQNLLDSVFILNLLLGGALALGLFVGAGWFSGLLGAPDTIHVLRVLAAGTFIASLGHIHHALLRRDLRFGVIAVVSSVSAVVTAMVSVLGAVLGQGYWAIVVGTMVGIVCSTAMVWCYDRWRPTWRLDLSCLRSIWGFSWNLFLSNVVFYLFTQVDKIIVSNVLGVSAVGTYSMAQRTVQAPMNAMSTVVGEVTFSAFSRRQEDDPGLRSGFLRSSRVIALVTFPLMCGLAAVATSLVPVVFGSQWLGLIPLIWLMAPVGAIQSVTLQSNLILLAKGRADIAFRWGLFSSAFLVGLELVGVRYGVVGVATAYAVGVVMLTVPTLMIAFRLIDMSLLLFGRQMWAQVAATALMVATTLGATAVTRSAGGGTFLELVVGLGVGAATYMITVGAARLPAWQDAVGALRSRAA